MRANSYVLFGVLAAVALTALLTWCSHKANAQLSPWPKQFGSEQDDAVCSVLVDSAGNVYVVGATEGSLFSTNAGGYDTFAVKYDCDGMQVWAIQVGTDRDDAPADAVLSSDGHLYLVGTTRGDMYGPNAGGDAMYGDVFIAKLSCADGSDVWSHQFGTAQDEEGAAIAVDTQNNLYVVGLTFGSLFGENSGPNGFAAKFVSGNLAWGTHLDVEMAEDVAIGSEGIYVCGATIHSHFSPKLGDFDAYVVRIGLDGTVQWGKQFGTATADHAAAVKVAADESVYVAGTMSGADVPGVDKAFLARYDATGQQIWLRSLDTARTTDLEWNSGLDYISAIAFDDDANILVTGSTGGQLFQSYAGGADVFVAKYDPAGSLTWSIQLGTAEDDFGADIAVSPGGDIFVVGTSFGNLYGPHAGGTDIFIASLP